MTSGGRQSRRRSTVCNLFGTYAGLLGTIVLWPLLWSSMKAM
jgi:hypothetical protein